VGVHRSGIQQELEEIQKDGSWLCERGLYYRGTESWRAEMVVDARGDAVLEVVMSIWSLAVALASRRIVSFLQNIILRSHPAKPTKSRHLRFVAPR